MAMGMVGMTTAGGREWGLGLGLGSGAELLGQEALGISTLPGELRPCWCHPPLSPPSVTPWCHPPSVQGCCGRGSKGHGVASGRL